MESKYYDKNMIDLISFVQGAYKDAFGIDTDEHMPDILRIEVEIQKILLFFSRTKTKAKNPPAANRFEADYWRKKITGDSILRPRIWKIICIICDYEKDHLLKRWYFTDNHISDPSILVLEIIKDRLSEIKNETSNLKTLSSKNGLLAQLTNFLENLETSGRFPQNGNLNAISRMEVFIRVRTELEHLITEIMLYLDNSCAYEDMKVVMDNSKELLSLGIECLHYSLRSQELLQESTVQSLRKPSSNRLADIMKCRLGELMQELVNTPVFLTLYPDVIESTDLINPIPQPIFPIDRLELESNLNIKTKLLGFLKAKEAETGIQPCCNNMNVLQTYILLHGLLEEMGRCILGCEHAFASSKAGGDMLVYGLINEPVAQITENLILYINQASRAFRNFYESLDKIYFEFARSKDLNGVQHWVNNLRKSRSALRRFKESTDITLDALVKVKSKAQRGIDNEKMSKIATNLKALVDINHSINSRKDSHSVGSDHLVEPGINGFFSRPVQKLLSQERVTVLEVDQGAEQLVAAQKSSHKKSKWSARLNKEARSSNLGRVWSDEGCSNERETVRVTK